MPGPARNSVAIAGVLLERGALRYTPGGQPVLEFLLAHRSARTEAGTQRQVECEMACLAMGPTALLLDGAAVGDAVEAKGFLAAKSLKRRSPVLHVETIEFIEGAKNGIQT